MELFTEAGIRKQIGEVRQNYPWADVTLVLETAKPNPKKKRKGRGRGQKPKGKDKQKDTQPTTDPDFDPGKYCIFC